MQQKAVSYAVYNQKEQNKMSDIKEIEETKLQKIIGVRSLNSAKDVKRLLARLVKSRLANDGLLDDSCLRAVTQTLMGFLKAEEAASLDDRLAEIESRLDEAEREAAARR